MFGNFRDFVQLKEEAHSSGLRGLLLKHAWKLHMWLGGLRARATQSSAHLAFKRVAGRMEALLYLCGCGGESTGERALRLEVARLWRSENLQNSVGVWKRVPGLISFTRPTPNTGMGVAVNHALKNSTRIAAPRHS